MAHSKNQELKVDAPKLAMSNKLSSKNTASPAPRMDMPNSQKSQQMQLRNDIENQINKLQQQAKQLQKANNKKPDTFKQIALNLVKTLTLTGKNALADRKLRQPQMQAALQQLSRGSKAIAGLVKQLKLDNNNAPQANDSAAPTPTPSADPTQTPTPRPEPSSRKEPRTARLADNVKSCANTAGTDITPTIDPSERLTHLAQACAGAIKATEHTPTVTVDKGL